MSDSTVEHALSLLVSGDPDAALRWSAAALESDAGSPAALVVTARALWRIGHKGAAIDGYTAAARRAAIAGDAPLAIAAIAELRAAGVEPEKLVAEVATLVCRPLVAESAWGELPAWRGSLQPVSPLLTRRALVSRATQLVYEAGGAEHPRSTTTAFLGALAPATFKELVTAFEAIMVPSGYRAVEEDREVPDLYVVAAGEVEISRRGRRAGTRSLALLESGAMFGEMSLLATLPSSTSAVTTRAAILLVASRTSIQAIGDRYRDLRLELGAHCRRQAVGNLGAACAFMTTVPVHERAALVDRMVSRAYARGERLVHAGDEATGLHLILTGEVALIGHEGTERVVLSTQTAGDVVGEVELVLCRHADTDAIAVCPTATLFLPRDEFFALALDHPAILHGLYSAAVRRVGETGEALESGTADVLDAEVQLDDTPVLLRAPDERPRPDSHEVESKPQPTLPAAPPVAPEARAASSPPPLAAAARPRAQDTLASKGAVSRPAPSLAPVATSSPPPPPPRSASASRTSFARRSAQGAALVAVAASVAAVLATRDDRSSSLSLPQTISPAAGESPPVASAPVLATASAPAASAEPARAPAASAVVPTSASPPPSTKAFLVSSLKKRRPSPPPAPASPATTTASAAPAPEPAASIATVAPSPPRPAASAAAPSAPPPELHGESEFGGRE